MDTHGEEQEREIIPLSMVQKFISVCKRRETGHV
jgi:hypothetical protein